MKVIKRIQSIRFWFFLRENTDQLRVAKIEEMGKIHKVFSDIQNQILGIPVATIIVATQMKQANGWDSQALINTAVVLGALFFTIMILFVLFNQWQTLTAINDELNHKKQQAEYNFKAIYEDIKDTFDSLTTRLLVQKIVFASLGIIVLCGLYLTFRFYFYLRLMLLHIYLADGQYGCLINYPCIIYITASINPNAACNFFLIVPSEHFLFFAIVRNEIPITK